jgi:predicted HAD superfamily phosphohydrolase YqeG
MTPIQIHSLFEATSRLALQPETLVDLLSVAEVQVLEQHGKPKVLAVDLDDTILRYVRGGGYGTPLPGMIDLLKQLQSEGWKIAIWTCRPNVERVKAKLREKGIPFDYVNDNPLGRDNDRLRKIHADVYLDDKAITARGTAAGLLQKIRNFRSWSGQAREEKRQSR